MPKGAVVDPGFDWRRETVWAPVPWDRTVLYEAHVRGYTMRHPAVAEHQRGTFAGLATREVIDYVKSLGVTSVELLPVHTFINGSTTSSSSRCPSGPAAAIGPGCSTRMRPRGTTARASISARLRRDRTIVAAVHARAGRTMKRHGAAPLRRAGR